MIKKISRDISLIKYRRFPLLEYDKVTEEEFSFYPITLHDHAVELKSNSGKELANELVKFYEFLEINKLIFFGAINTKWISDYTLKRKDDSRLIESLDFFKINKLSEFNGAIEVGEEQLKPFFEYFIYLTKVDSGFYHNYFIDENQKLLGFIHYSGEVQFNILDQSIDSIYSNSIDKTDFMKK